MMRLMDNNDYGVLQVFQPVSSRDKCMLFHFTSQIKVGVHTILLPIFVEEETDCLVKYLAILYSQ